MLNNGRRQLWQTPAIRGSGTMRGSVGQTLVAEQRAVGRFFTAGLVLLVRIVGKLVQQCALLVKDQQENKGDNKRETMQHRVIVAQSCVMPFLCYNAVLIVLLLS